MRAKQINILKLTVNDETNVIFLFVAVCRFYILHTISKRFSVLFLIQILKEHLFLTVCDYIECFRVIQRTNWLFSNAHTSQFRLVEIFNCEQNWFE